MCRRQWTDDESTLIRNTKKRDKKELRKKITSTYKSNRKNKKKRKTSITIRMLLEYRKIEK